VSEGCALVKAGEDTGENGTDGSDTELSAGESGVPAGDGSRIGESGAAGGECGCSTGEPRFDRFFLPMPVVAALELRALLC
jgi:hypothetical protein